MARRTGIPTIIKTLHEACRLLTKFRPIIYDVTNADDDIQTAIDNVLTACVGLTALLVTFLEPGD